MAIGIKNERELDSMRKAGRVTALVLDVLKNSIKVGMKTRELNEIAEHELKALGGRPSFKGYPGYPGYPYPASLCVSINDEIVHGIPGERIIKDGDIVSLDFGAIVDGYQGDAAITVMMGDAGPLAKGLMSATEVALEAGIMAARAGNRLGDISAEIQRCAESRGFTVIREYTGHGIGREMHEDPLVPNFGEPGTGPELKKGMTLAIEPMLTTGGWHTKQGRDHWLVSTADGSLSAHFEHTVAITGDKAEVLTRVQ
jgi:methionyl aminopeptidase